MTRIRSIALCTFRECVREKLVFVALLFGGILMASAWVLSPLAVGARMKVMTDVGLAGISILGVLTAVMVGSVLVHKEVEKRAVYIVLTRPVSRLEYVAGKFAGLAASVFLMMAVMTALLACMILFTGGRPGGAIFAAVLLSCVEMTVMCAVTVFFSTFTTPILTSFFSLCIFVAGSLSGDLRVFAQKFGGGAFARVTDAVYYLMPNLAVFNLRHEAVHGLPWSPGDLVLPFIYGLVYVGVVLYFAWLVFRRREFA